jgi:septal ring factor EnvC (AmiA/AmiB activator)
MGILSSITSSVASGGITTYIKIGLAVAVLTAAAGLYFTYEHMASEVKAQQVQIGQMQEANREQAGQITGLHTDINNVLTRVQEADAARSAINDQLNTLQTKISQMNTNFVVSLKALKTPQAKTTYVNTELKQQLFCIEQLTVPPANRDKTYSITCSVSNPVPTGK